MTKNTYFGPVVTSTALSENEVVWSEDLSKRTGSDRVHGTRLQINKDGTWNIFATYKLEQQG